MFNSRRDCPPNDPVQSVWKHLHRCGRLVLVAAVLGTISGTVACANQPATLETTDATHQDAIVLTGRVMDSIEIQLPQTDRTQPTLDPAIAFDSARVRVEAQITAPNGAVETVRGFYREDYRLAFQNQREVAMPTGESAWVVRYRPRLEGRYEIAIALMLPNQSPNEQAHELAIESWHYELVAQSRPDDAPKAMPFIHIDPDHPEAMATAEGDAAVMVGLNLCWMVGDQPMADFERYLDRAEAAGVNWIRLWLAPDFVSTCLERKSEPGVPSTGAGRIDQRAAHRVDHILELAEARGIYVQMCIESFNSLRTGSADPFWAANALNAAQGGPLESPEAFFTDEETQRLFRQRLDYLVARWGDQSNVFAWELWNEVDLTDGFWDDDRPVLNWHRSMGRHLKSIDPYGHLITTSMSNDLSMRDIWKVPEIDLIQTHHYGGPDLAAVVLDLDRMLPGRFGKPHLVGEAGISHSGTYTAQADPHGIHLHQMLWSGVVSPARATGMTWWWDDYVEAVDLWSKFRAIANFTDDMRFQRGGAMSLPDAHFAFDAESSAAERAAGDVAFQGAMRSWKPGFLNAPVELRIEPDGTVRGRETLTSVLHGEQDPSGKTNPLTIHADYASDGAFEVSVHDIGASDPANITITVDDTVVLNQDFVKDVHGAFAVQRLSVPITAGPHAIAVTNQQRQWASVEYALRGVVTADQPPLASQAIIAGNMADADEQTPVVCGWIRQRQWSWDEKAYPRGAEPLTPVDGVQMTQTGLPDGVYRLVWIDTETGLPTNHLEDNAIELDVSDQSFTIALPPIQTDLAYKIYRR